MLWLLKMKHKSFWQSPLSLDTLMGLPRWHEAEAAVVEGGSQAMLRHVHTTVKEDIHCIPQDLVQMHNFLYHLRRLSTTLSLIGHSAGGWLARVYMEEFGMSHISLLLTLRTPHLQPPKGTSGVIDQARGLLNYVEQKCSKAVYTPQMKYVCIAGRYIEGAQFFGQSNAKIESVVPINGCQPVPEAAVMKASSNSPPIITTFRTRLVGQGSKQVCGQADVWVDGVVPEVSAHLEGALNISLDGVYHSPVGSDDELRPWCGSPAILEQWVEHLLN